jgi:uncharacterized SCP-like protein
VEPYRPRVPRSRVNSLAVSAVVREIDAAMTPEPGTVRDAVRALLALLGERSPGRSVEVRVPPYGAVQCVAGPGHTRGTPPNVVEADPLTFLRLATGRLTWDEAMRTGGLRASGVRSDLSHLFPIWTEVS